MLTTLIFTICIAVIAAVVRWRSYLFGKTTEKLKNAEKVLETIQKAKDAVEHSDPDIDSKLRDRYRQ